MKLQDFDVDSLMQTLALRENDSAGDLSSIQQEVLSELVSVEADLEKNDYQVTVCMPQIRINNNRESKKRLFGERRDAPAEVYVVSMAIDLSGLKVEAKRTGNVEADKKALISLPEGVSDQIFSQISRTASNSFAVNSTPIFNEIFDGDSLPLLGNGITLYGPNDPKGFLELHIAVMEDDKAYRDFGKFVEETAKAMEIDKLVEAALKAASLANPIVGILSRVFKGLFSAVLNRMQNNEDDVIQQLHFSSIVHQRYCPGIVPFDERGATGHLHVMVNEVPKPQ